MPENDNDEKPTLPKVSTTSLFKMPATNALASSWTYDQGVYQAEVQIAMSQGLSLLKNAASDELQNPLSGLYQFLCEKRNQIARKMQPKGDALGPSSDFGKSRSNVPRSQHNPGITFLTHEGRYSAMYPALISKLKRMQNEENDCVRVVSYGRYDDCFLKNAFIVEKDDIVLSALGYKTNFAFTDLVYPDPFPNGRRQDACLKGSEKNKYLDEHVTRFMEEKMDDPTIVIIHPSPDDIVKVFRKIDLIYAKMLEEGNTDVNKTIEDIAAIAWWLSQAMACKRGNASVTEMIVGILFQQFEINYKPYQDPDKISLDLNAIFEPNLKVFTEQFKKSYSLDLVDECKSSMGLGHSD